METGAERAAAWETVAGGIGELDEAAMAAARRRLDSLTKPLGSLGHLEELAVRLAGVTGRVCPTVAPRSVVVMVADHGVTEEGVSAFPSEVTAQMVYNFLRGGAAINVLARLAGARVRVVDVGVAAHLDRADGLDVRKVRPGSANMARGPALAREEAAAALEAGIAVAVEEVRSGARLLCLGDMGIGNTTPSTAVVSVFTGQPPAELVGRGTGLDAAGMERKLAAIERAIAVNEPDPADPLGVLAKVGGLEIAGLAGVALGGAWLRVPVVVDGLIAGAAALAAAALAPRVRPFLFAGHLSAEPAHGLALASLGLRPLLSLDMRLGEGTGAVLASLVLEAACRIIGEMATFEQAGVSGSLDGTVPGATPGGGAGALAGGEGKAG